MEEAARKEAEAADAEAEAAAPVVLMATKHTRLKPAYEREVTVNETHVSTRDPATPKDVGRLVSGGGKTNEWRLKDVKDATIVGSAVWVKLPGSVAPPKAATMLEVHCKSEDVARDLSRRLGFPVED